MTGRSTSRARNDRPRPPTCSRSPDGEFGGRYLRFDEDNPLVLVVGEPEFSVGLCAMSKVQGRVVNGPEDDIPFFYAGFVDAVSRRTSATVL
jgi:hypothetical protein